jgi:hypothetical protein
MIPGHYLVHRWYPPGLPVLLAPAVYAGGLTVNWLLVKWTMAVVGLAGVLAVWHLVRRLTSSELTADIAAALIGLNPFYWQFSHMALADVPATAWIFASLYLVDRFWAKRQVCPTEAFCVGLVCGAGMLIKAIAICLIFAPVAYILGPRRADLGLRAWMRTGLLFGVGFILPALLWMLPGALQEGRGWDAHSQLHGYRMKYPVPSNNYLPLPELLQVPAHNVQRFAIYHLPSQTLPFLWGHSSMLNTSFFAHKGTGWIALFLTVLLLLACIPSSINWVGLHLTAAGIAAINILYAYGWGSRYWVPASILVLALLALRLGPALEKAPRTFRYGSLLILGFTLVMNLGWYVTEHEHRPFSQDGPWKELVELFAKAPEYALQTEGVLTPNSLTFQLLTGYPAPLASPSLDPQYDHMVSRLDGRSPQPPAGSRLVYEVYPWALYTLPRTMALHELVDMRRLGMNGIRMQPQ